LYVHLEGYASRVSLTTQEYTFFNLVSNQLAGAGLVLGDPPSHDLHQSSPGTQKPSAGRA
jgi:hypothetical protein